MKQTILATIVLLLIIYFVYPINTSLINNKEKDNRQVTSIRDNHFDSNNYSNRSITLHNRSISRNTVSSSRHCYNTIIPFGGINSNYDIKGYKFSYVNSQQLFADNVSINYQCKLKPFEEVNLNTDNIVAIGNIQRVDFGNNDDFPNNPAKAPLGDDIFPLILFAVAETTYIAYTNVQKNIG